MGFEIGQEALHLCVLGAFPGTCAERSYMGPILIVNGNPPVFHARRPTALSYNKNEAAAHLKNR